ncbi:MAG: hypothetical protein WCR52_14670 [Bacteroidota bacterium]
MARLLLIKSISFTLFFCAAYLLTGQTADSFPPPLHIPVNARYATSDHLGNIYVINARHDIEKYAPSGRLVSQYSTTRLGVPTYIDATNPLKIAVWYPSYGSIVLLDRTMTELGVLNLIDAGFPEVRVVAASQDGNFWLYDELAFKLRKVSADGTPLFESPSLQQTLEHRPVPTAIRDDGNRVFMSDTVQGLLLFDVYAQYQRTVLHQQFNDFQIIGNNVVYLDAGLLKGIDLRTFQTVSRALPAGLHVTPGKIWLTTRYLMAQEGAALSVFSLRPRE